MVSNSGIFQKKPRSPMRDCSLRLRVQASDANHAEEGNQAQLGIDLDVIQSGTISVAIEQWMLSFESETKDENLPSLRMLINSPCITLVTQVNGLQASAELIVPTDGGAQGRAVLIRLEASFLGTLFESLVEDTETAGQEFVG